MMIKPNSWEKTKNLRIRINASHDLSPDNFNSAGKNINNWSNINKQKQEFIEADQQIVKTISQKRLEGRVGVQKQIKNTPDAVKINMISNYQSLINKRKKIRSEARNQPRSIIKEAAKFMKPTQDLFQINGIRDKSKESQRVTRRKQNVMYSGEVHDSIWAPKSSDRTSNINESLNTNEHSISHKNLSVIDPNQTNEVDEVYQTYRLPSISPNSKLPSWFLNKRGRKLKSSEKWRINLNKSKFLYLLF